MSTRRSLTLSALLLLAAASPGSALPTSAAHPAPVLAGAEDVQTLFDELKAERDAAEPSKVRELAEIRSREAMEALLQLYETMSSVYMRREVVRGLALFDGVGEAEQPALQKLMDVATGARERELREAAVDSLGECDKLGKHFLALIVESGADEEVREHAMRLHVQRSEASDADWYRQLYQVRVAAAPQGDKKDRRRGKKDEAEPVEEEPKAGKVLPKLRFTAFEALAGGLDEKDLRAALSDPYWRIRAHALEVLSGRDAKAVEGAARERFENIEERPEVRAEAARVLIELNGAREAKEFIDVGKKFITPTQLRYSLADLLSALQDPKVDSQLSRLVGKGKEHEKLFALRAARRVQDKKIDKAFRRGLADKEDAIRIASCAVIAERGDTDALKDLMKLVEKGKSADVKAAALEAVSTLRKGQDEWIAELVALADHEELDVRNAALLEIGREAGAKHLDLLKQALQSDNWSTRLAALKGLVAARQKESVAALVERMPEEHGRMLHEFADALWSLSGEPFRTSTSAWQQWWKNEAAGFEVLSEAELRKREAEEEERRLRQVSKADFFGIRIISERVIFIIDVSGSMNEQTRGRYVGEQGDTRIAIAKRELKKCVDALAAEALFNIITFSGDVDAWLDEGVASSQGASRDEAKNWVEKLGALGGTNLYDSIREAFRDPDVDTIFILSDGEPTAGEITEPFLIREEVQRWNDRRGIVIHTIAVGGELQILQWLAEDSGGSHVKFR